MFDGGESWYNTVRHLICFLRRSNLTAPPSLLWEWQHTKALVYFWRKIHSIVCGTSSRYSIAGQRFKNKKSNLTRRIDNAPDHHTFFTKKTCTNYGKKKIQTVSNPNHCHAPLARPFSKGLSWSAVRGTLFAEARLPKQLSRKKCYRNLLCMFIFANFWVTAGGWCNLHPELLECAKFVSVLPHNKLKSNCCFFFQLLFAAFTESVVAPTPRQDHW
jgi:hypothetical protein